MRILGLMGYSQAGKEHGIHLENPTHKELARELMVAYGRLGRAMNPKYNIPPGTVPLIIHWPTGILHVFEEFSDTHFCNPRFCKIIGFRVIGDPEKFNYKTAPRSTSPNEG